MFSEFYLVAKNRKCSGEEENGCLQTSAENCARLCHNTSSMFAFPNSDGRCHGGRCKCLCQTGASANGTCDEVENERYDLYKFRSNEMGKIDFEWHYYQQYPLGWVDLQILV